jgi:hypothetical protein
VTLRLPNQRLPATITRVDNFPRTDLSAMKNPFQPGMMAVLTLGNPREKIWGALLAITPEGLTLCGVELASFEDLIAIVKEGEPFAPNVIFFPMHRVERMELDLPDGGIPSLSQRFVSKTGVEPSELFLGSQPGGLSPVEGRQ